MGYMTTAVSAHAMGAFYLASVTHPPGRASFSVQEMVKLWYIHPDSL